MKMTYSYWVARRIRESKQADKELNKILNKLKREYAYTQREIEKILNAEFSLNSQDEVTKYEHMRDKLSKRDQKLLYEDYDALVEKYPEAENYRSVRNNYYKITRAEGLLKDIDNKLISLFGKQADELGTLLRSSANITSGHKLNSKTLDRMLKKKWVNSKNFSDRVWTNKKELSKALNTTLKEGIKQGKGSRNIAREISRKLDVSRADAFRIVRTEQRYIMNQSTLETYKEADVKKYKILIISDDRTSETCLDKDGKIYFVKDAEVNVNYPPFHPNCRTTTIPVYDD